MALFFRLGLAGLLLLLTVLPASAETLYNQPPFSEKELSQFIADLPRFRAWIKTNKEKAHPIVNEAGEPDFLYSKNAAGYIEAAGWKPERFFCIMGRAAAAVAIIQQGDAITKEPPVEMPNVSDDELDVVRRNLPGQHHHIRMKGSAVLQQHIPTAVLFPGQGSQEPGMGRDVAEASKEAMELWKKAEQISGLPLRAVYWESDDAALMADTKHLQPALTVVNVTLWQALSGKLSPACAAGHSLGEYSALAAAGSLSPESALELVSLRGKLMADADPDGKGGMAAILKLNREAVNEIAKAAAEATGEILIVANHNTPAQFVISGTKAAVEAALPLVKEKKGRAVPLPVSGAFHSPLMDTAAQELAKALNKMTWSRPRFPVYSNVTGKAVTDGESLRELATVQMSSSVLWIDTIANQWHDGIRSWVEVGPKGTLSRMVKPILDAVPVEEEVAITAVGSLEGVNAFA